MKNLQVKNGKRIKLSAMQMLMMDLSGFLSMYSDAIKVRVDVADNHNIIKKK